MKGYAKTGAGAGQTAPVGISDATTDWTTPGMSDYKPSEMPGKIGDALDTSVSGPDAHIYDWGQSQEAWDWGADARGKQDALGDAMWDRVQGNAPSVAELQMRQAEQRNLAAARSTAASSRGGSLNRAMAQRQSAGDQQRMALQTNRDASMLRAQEQMAAEGRYSQHLAQQRGQDYSAYDAEVGRQQGAAGTRTQESSLRQDAKKATAENKTALIGGAMEGVFDSAGAIGGAIGGMSDPDAKRNVSDASDKEIAEFLQSIEPKRYEYRDGLGAPGEHVGVMTDDLQRSDLGSLMVDTSGEHDRIRMQDGLFTVIASLGSISDRLRALEGK